MRWWKDERIKAARYTVYFSCTTKPTCNGLTLQEKRRSSYALLILLPSSYRLKTRGSMTAATRLIPCSHFGVYELDSYAHLPLILIQQTPSTSIAHLAEIDSCFRSLHPYSASKENLPKVWPDWSGVSIGLWVESDSLSLSLMIPSAISVPTPLNRFPG